MKLKQIAKGVILGTGLLAAAIGCSGDKNVKGIVIEKHLGQSESFSAEPILSLIVENQTNKKDTLGFRIIGNHEYDSLPQRMYNRIKEGDTLYINGEYYIKDRGHYFRHNDSGELVLLLSRFNGYAEITDAKVILNHNGFINLEPTEILRGKGSKDPFQN
ncbi:MAG: hypothetical protein AABW50_03275 [Nanoarchaeota archaeon]